MIVRSGFEEMKASPWEKEDAMHEDIPILNFLVPKEFTHENGKLTGVLFEKVKAEYDAKGRRNLVPTGEPDQHFACDDVLVAVGQENAFPWIERDIGIEFDKWDMPVVDAKTMRLDQPEGVLRRRRRVRAEEHHLGGGARPRRRGLDRQAAARARTSPTARRRGVDLVSQKMGIHEWSYDNDISLDQRYRGAAARQGRWRCSDIKAEVELGFDRKLALKEAQRCLNCDVQTVFTGQLCIECDACVDICPMDCITFTAERRGSRPAHAAEGAGAQPDPGPLCRRRPQDRPHHGQGRGRLPALRAVRRALPDRRLGHAEIPASK